MLFPWHGGIPLPPGSLYIQTERSLFGQTDWLPDRRQTQGRSMSCLISRKFIVYHFTLQDPGRCNSLDLDHSLLTALIKMLSRIVLCHRTITLDTSTSHIYSFKYPSNHIKNEVDKITFNILFNPTHPNNIISSCDKYEKHYWGILHFS